MKSNTFVALYTLVSNALNQRQCLSQRRGTKHYGISY